MSSAAARNSRSLSFAPRNRHRKIFTKGILRPSADLCKCHGALAVQLPAGRTLLQAAGAATFPRRAPPSCKLRRMTTIAIEEHFITPMYRQKVAALATADRRAAADELGRCVAQLGFKGAMIHGHTQGSFLDEKKYWVIFERAQALDVPLYLHPTLPHPDAVKAYFQGYEDLARAGWGFAMDTSCHFLRIVFSGVFDAYPRLRIILGHLGEGLPFAMHRLNDHTWRAAARRGLRKTPLEYLKDNLLVTTSGNWYEPAFLCTLLALGADNILFAVDWPYEPNTAGMEFLRTLSISDVDREKIAHGNAERILRM